MKLPESMRSTLKFLWTHPLLQGRPVYAFARFFSWQLMSRLRRSPVAFAWVGGSKLWLRRGWGSLTGNYYAGLYDFQDMAFLLHLLRPGDRFVDVGANMGSYSILASAVCRARSISYEPVPAAFARLLANRDLNDLAGLVDCRPSAVGAAPGILAMTSGLDAANHVVTADDPHAVKVPVVALDDDLPEPPVLLKVDVEGFETEVLGGARRCLGDLRLKAVIIELNGSGLRYGRRDADLHALLLAAGFAAYRYSPQQRSLAALDQPGDANTRYCRDLAFVEARLRVAETFTVAGRSF
jgi:FkbM family methyltransferase